MNNLEALIYDIQELLRKPPYFLDRNTLASAINVHMGRKGICHNIDFLIEEGVIAEIVFGHGVHIYVDGREKVNFRKHNASMGA